MSIEQEERVADVQWQKIPESRSRTTESPVVFGAESGLVHSEVTVGGWPVATWSRPTYWGGWSEKLYQRLHSDQGGWEWWVNQNQLPWGYGWWSWLERILYYGGDENQTGFAYTDCFGLHGSISRLEMGRWFLVWTRFFQYRADSVDESGPHLTLCTSFYSCKDCPLWISKRLLPGGSFSEA